MGQWIALFFLLYGIKKIAFKNCKIQDDFLKSKCPPIEYQTLRYMNLIVHEFLLENYTLTYFFYTFRLHLTRSSTMIIRLFQTSNEFVR